ncbi:uncharacterized protein EV422DRAFT_570492 [Fimicolochytrium jonesii]|uniref:uncharacterized protein n=1 Tax=Fimicolochytrium jonesii TaxID=1396493 RepID=UPI0022FE9CEF|nr:uncharacterized protein EV422DRAFT_570492 [Fimicolochytrium jonesii]KAI8817728.1 hypothetical protein EV422DRAFT_570492 [Fimicolochytrium jonesii]
MASKEVKALSTSVLALKFMHRAEEAKVRQKLEEEQKQAAKEAQWVLEGFGFDERDSVQFDYDNSHVPFMESSFGRKSFGSFNKEIEKLDEEATKSARLKRAQEVEGRESVSAQEMVDRFQTIGASKSSKRKRPASAQSESGDTPPTGKRAATTTTNAAREGPGTATRFRGSAKRAEEARVRGEVEDLSGGKKAGFLRPE